MGSIGFGEMIVVAVIAILVYGKDLPGVARKVGLWYNRIRNQAVQIKHEIEREIPDDTFLDEAAQEPETEASSELPALPAPEDDDAAVGSALPFDPSRPPNGSPPAEEHPASPVPPSDAPKPPP